MYGCLLGDICVSIHADDRKEIDAKGHIGCLTSTEQRLELIVQDAVPREDAFCEEGFRVRMVRGHANHVAGCAVFISQERYAQLLKNRYLASRWAGEIRIHITYWDEAMPVFDEWDTDE